MGVAALEFSQFTSGAEEVIPKLLSFSEKGPEVFELSIDLLQGEKLPDFPDLGFPHQPGRSANPGGRSNIVELGPEGLRALGPVPCEGEIVKGE